MIPMDILLLYLIVLSENLTSVFSCTMQLARQEVQTSESISRLEEYSSYCNIISFIISHTPNVGRARKSDELTVDDALVAHVAA